MVFMDKELNYWQSCLKHCEVLELPYDKTRPVVSSGRGASIHFEVSEQKYKVLKTIAASQKSTLSTLMFSIYALLLYRLSQQEKFHIGVADANRNVFAANSTNLESMIGLFVNSLPISVEIKNGNLGFIDFTKDVESSLLNAFENRALPFEKMIEGVGIERDSAISPVFQVFYSFQNTPLDQSLLENTQ